MLALPMDYTLARTLDRFSAHHDAVEDALSGFMHVAEPLFALIIVVLWFARGRGQPAGRRAAVAAAASFGAAAVLAAVIGKLVDRERPFVAHPATIHPFLAHAADAGFPSDHATAAFAVAVAIALRLPLWGALVGVLAAVVAVGRVFLGLHYPGDVAAGALLGAAVAVLLYAPPIRRRLDGLADFGGRVLGHATRRPSPAG